MESHGIWIAQKNTNPELYIHTVYLLLRDTKLLLRDSVYKLKITTSFCGVPTSFWGTRYRQFRKRSTLKRSTKHPNLENDAPKSETTVGWRTTTLSLAWRKPNRVEEADASNCLTERCRFFSSFGQFWPFWSEIGYGMCSLVLNGAYVLEEATSSALDNKIISLLIFTPTVYLGLTQGTDHFLIFYTFFPPLPPPHFYCFLPPPHFHCFLPPPPHFYCFQFSYCFPTRQA